MRSLLMPILLELFHQLAHRLADFREGQGAHHALCHPFLVAEIIRLIQSDHFGQRFQFLPGQLFAVHQAFHPLTETLCELAQRIGEHLRLFGRHVIGWVAAHWRLFSRAKEQREKLIENGEVLYILDQRGAQRQAKMLAVLDPHQIHCGECLRSFRQ